MPRYMSLVKYTADAYQGVRADGFATRRGALDQLAQSMGGTIESMDFMTAGEWDFAAVVDLPPEAAIALSSFSMGTGVVERIVTYELFTGEQMDAAIAAHTPDYTPPGD